MPAPTNPRKQALMPSGPLRVRLRAAGHHLSPIVQVGKEGVTPAVLSQLSQALHDHELVKVKLGGETPEDRYASAGRLGAGTGASIAQILGRTVLIYRKHPERPRFEPALSEASARAPAGATPRRGPAPPGRRRPETHRAGGGRRPRPGRRA